MDQDTIDRLKALLGKVSQATVGEGNEGTLQAQGAPEGYGAQAQGLPADPGAAGGVKPEGHPGELLVGGLGSKLGGAMARDAGSVLGNEVGAVGSDITGLIPKARAAVSGGADMSGNELMNSAQNATNQSLGSSVNNVELWQQEREAAAKAANRAAKMAAFRKMSGR